MGNVEGRPTIIFFVREMKVQKKMMIIIGVSITISSNVQVAIIIVMPYHNGMKMIGIHMKEK